MAEYINMAMADMWEAYGKAKDDIDMAEQFERLPTIDIVHCKECKYNNVDKMGWYCNKHYHRYADENTHFCSDGERERSDE